MKFEMEVDPQRSFWRVKGIVEDPSFQLNLLSSDVEIHRSNLPAKKIGAAYFFETEEGETLLLEGSYRDDRLRVLKLKFMLVNSSGSHIETVQSKISFENTKVPSLEVYSIEDIPLKSSPNLSASNPTVVISSDLDFISDISEKSNCIPVYYGLSDKKFSENLPVAYVVVSQASFSQSLSSYDRDRAVVIPQHLGIRDYSEGTLIEMLQSIYGRSFEGPSNYPLFTKWLSKTAVISQWEDFIESIKKEWL